MSASDPLRPQSGTYYASLPLFGVITAFAAMPYLGFAAQGGGQSGRAAAADPALSVSQTGGGLEVERVAAPADVRVHAIDVDTGEVVLSRGGGEPVDPLRTQDLVTAAASLAILKPEFRFQTAYYSLGRVRGGVLYGDVLVQGFGDPSTGEEKLKWIARQIKLAGVDRVTGSIRLDDTYFRTGEEPLAEDDAEGGADAGAADEAAAAEVAGAGAEAADEEAEVAESAEEEEAGGEVAGERIPGSLMFAQNRARIVIRPTQPGSRAEVMVDPHVGYVQVEPFVETSPFPRRVRAVVTGGASGTNVILSGAVSPYRGPAELEIGVASGARYLGTALYTFLRREGVSMRQRITTKPKEGRRRWLVGDASDPLGELLGMMLHEGGERGRVYTDAILRTLAIQASGDVGSLAVGLATVKDWLTDEVGLPAKEIELRAPGEPGTALAPAHLTAVLQKMHARYDLKSEFDIALGAGETQRLLAHQIEEPALLRRLRAVADTVPGRAAYVGYAAGPERRVAFALFVEDERAPPSVLYTRAEEVLTTLVEATGPLERSGAAQVSRKAP